MLFDHTSFWSFPTSQATTKAARTHADPSTPTITTATAPPRNGQFTTLQHDEAGRHDRAQQALLTRSLDLDDDDDNPPRGGDGFTHDTGVAVEAHAGIGTRMHGGTSKTSVTTTTPSPPPPPAAARPAGMLPMVCCMHIHVHTGAHIHIHTYWRTHTLCMDDVPPLPCTPVHSLVNKTTNNTNKTTHHHSASITAQPPAALCEPIHTTPGPPTRSVPHTTLCTWPAPHPQHHSSHGHPPPHPCCTPCRPPPPRGPLCGGGPHPPEPLPQSRARHVVPPPQRAAG